MLSSRTNGLLNAFLRSDFTILLLKLVHQIRFFCYVKKCMLTLSHGSRTGLRFPMGKNVLNMYFLQFVLSWCFECLRRQKYLQQDNPLASRSGYSMHFTLYLPKPTFIYLKNGLITLDLISKIYFLDYLSYWTTICKYRCTMVEFLNPYLI